MCSNKENLKYNFVYLKDKFGKEKINRCLTALIIDSNELIKICDYFEQKFGKEKLKECIGGISGIYSLYEKVRKTLDLSIWTIHSHLLTPTIFQKNAEEIEKKYNIIINDLKEKNLLCPTIMYRISIQEMLAKINYIKENNLPLVVNGKINSIFGMSDANLRKKYGISKKELNEKYSITLEELKEKYYKEGSSK